MDRDKIIDGLKMTMELCVFDPSTGEEIEPHLLNDINRATYDACKGALEILERLDTDSDTISRQAAISAICSTCGKIDCDKMDKCEKLQLPPANCSEIPNNSDTISRQTAQRLFGKALTYKEQIGKLTWTTSEVKQWLADCIEQLPPVHGTNLAEVGTDCISRQAAIDRINKQREHLQPDIYPQDKIGDAAYRICAEFIERLPSAEPQIIACGEGELSTNLAEVGTDCISRQALLDKFEPWLKVKDYNDGELNMLKAVLYEIRFMRPAQPERIKGRWTRDNACSECGCQPWFSGDIHNYNFCPNCGADMREVTT